MPTERHTFHLSSKIFLFAADRDCCRYRLLGKIYWVASPTSCIYSTVSTLKAQGTPRERGQDYFKSQKTMTFDAR